MFGCVTYFVSVLIYVSVINTVRGEDYQNVNRETPGKNEDWHGEWFPYSPEIDKNPVANTHTVNSQKSDKIEDWHGDWFPYTPEVNVVYNPVANFQAANSEKSGKNKAWKGEWFPYFPEVENNTIANFKTASSQKPDKNGDWHGDWFPYSPEENVDKTPVANFQTANSEKSGKNKDWHGDWFPYSPTANVDSPVDNLQRINSQKGGRSEGWIGQWFPYSPEINIDNNPVVNNPHPNIYDPKHGVEMGVRSADCDDAETNLEVDWDNGPINHTCFEDSKPYRPNSGVQALYSVDNIPKSYSALHKCMNEPINYNVIIPTYGTHRPLWAKYGEYLFLPKQRWIHNLEHGSVVMLYHPCADANEVQLLRNLVNRCLYRHVITPYNLLSATRPLALVAWGRRLEMSKVDPEIVTEFIRTNALRGPEQTARDGQYNHLLIEHSKIISDLNDTILCQK